MASSSPQTPFSADDLLGLGCTRLNDNVYELYKPASGPISMQVVFFHGFEARGCGDAFIRTWMTRDGTACWLNTWLVAFFPQAHILSVSYDSSTRTSESEGRLDMYLIGENLVRMLVEILGVGQNWPVVLVGHCVGGLVLKEVCLKASLMGMQEEVLSLPHRKFLANLRGMFFYATAHLGSHIPLTNLIQGGPLLKYLHLLNTSSARINDAFTKLRRRHNWMTYGVMEANETRTLMLMSIFDHEIIPGLDSAAISEYLLVVGEGSGRYDVDKFAVISDVDHFTICNPEDQYSNSVQILVNFLEQILEEEDETSRDLQRRLQLRSNLICFDGRIQDVIELLDLKNPEPVRLSIVGMDGIGKSTLVKQILVRIQHQYDYACFLELETVPQKQAWTDFEKLFAENLYRGSGKKVSLGMEAPWSLLRRKKVLIIVDDVEAEDQIEPLLKSNWCGEGSRLIITTCIRSLMPQILAFIEFDVPYLSRVIAEELFEAHVGGSLLRRIPRELVSHIVRECDGLPLALELVGRYLSKRKEELVWRGVLQKLRIRTTKALDGVGENQIWSKLKVIFDELDLAEQKIFLDLATFDVYGPEKKQYDLNVLKVAWRTGLGSDGILTDMAIENLRDRSFLQIVPGSVKSVLVQADMDGICWNIYIHKLLRNMGKWLSRLLNDEVELRHARGLWELEEIKYVLNQSKGEAAQRNRRLEVMSVAMEPNGSLSRENIKWGSIRRFEALRLLRMSNVDMTKGSDEFILPQSLAMLHLIDCSGPQRRIFSYWQPDWPIREENVECLRRLSVLLLENCSSIRLPKNIHRLQNLQILLIHDSTKDTILQLPETFGFLPALEHLSLSAPVEKLPDSLLALPLLKSMNLSGCSILKSWPIPARVDPSSHLTCLTCLELSNLPAFAHLPDTFGGLRSLEKLSLERCPALERLPEGFSALEQLTRLYIGRCEKFERLCESFHKLYNLQHLELQKLPALRILPNNFGQLLSLQSFRIRECTSFKELPDSFLDLQPLLKLIIVGCDSLVSLWQDLPGQCGLSREPKRLQSLILRECPRLQGLPESIVQFSALSTMTLDHCNNLGCLPGSLMQIPSLKTLQIWDCEKLVQLPEVTSQLSILTALSIERCPNLSCLPESVGELKSLETLVLGQGQRFSQSLGLVPSQQKMDINQGGCRNLPESLGQLKKLKRLSLIHCEWLGSLPEAIGQLTSLEQLVIRSCGNLVCLPDSLSQLLSLRELSIGHCGNLHHLPDALGQLPSLTKLTLEHCGNFVAFPDSLGQLASLIRLTLDHCGSLLSLPDSLGQVSSLTKLDIANCGRLRTLPESLGQLSSLRQLRICSCESISGLPESVCQLRRLSQLKLSKCGHIERLPQSMGDLKSLTALNLRDCGVLEDVPVSLGQLTKLETFALPACRNPGSLPFILQQLTALRLLKMKSRGGRLIKGISESLTELTALGELRISSNCDKFEFLFESLWQFTSLMTLKISHADDLEHIPESVGQLSRLRKLDLESCRDLKELPKTLGGLAALEELLIQDCGVLETLPESIGQLKTLQMLIIRRCDSFDALPESIGDLKLVQLYIQRCRNLKQLPSSLPSVARFSMVDCGISHDPRPFKWTAPSSRLF